MTPKEKAEELFNRMCLAMATEKTEYAYYTNVIHAKQCALIAVDEILSLMIKFHNRHIEDNSNEIIFWELVKEEINLL
jgi:hypothetical protein